MGETAAAAAAAEEVEAAAASSMARTLPTPRIKTSECMPVYPSGFDACALLA